MMRKMEGNTAVINEGECIKMKVNLLNHIVKEGLDSQVKVHSFQPGQIITGKISKLFPNNIAVLQIGAQKVVAQLEAPLEAGKSYWFQVQPGEDKTRLKVLVNASEGKQDNPHAALLKQLSLPLTEKNQSFIHFLLKEQLPVKKEIFQLAGELPKGSGLNAVEAETLRVLLNKELPLTKYTFQAVLSALKNEPFAPLLEALRNLLAQNTDTESGTKLLTFLQNIMHKQLVDGAALHAIQSSGEDLSQTPAVSAGQSFGDRSLLVQYLKDMMKQMGLSHEQEFVQFLKHGQEGGEMNRDSLKSLLINFLAENPAGLIKETAEKVLHKITGFQLLGQESGPIGQIAFQLPIMLGQKAVDLTMQWSGRKQKNGKIDPAYCRVLFYIELEYLQETVVDMQVQNHVIRLEIINEHEQVKMFAAPFIEELKENLKTMNFTLSAVQFTRPEEKESGHAKVHGTAVIDNSKYTGVDIRI